LTDIKAWGFVAKDTPRLERAKLDKNTEESAVYLLMGSRDIRPSD